MKAIHFHEHGDVEKLQYGDIETPTPGLGEVQIAIKAAAMNRLDLFVLAGWRGLKLAYPHVPGADGAGIVSAVGEGVTEVAVGDPVVINGTISCGKCEYCEAGQDNMCLHGGILGENFPGTFGEYAVVPESSVLKMPADFPFEEAAAASLVFLTAWHSAITKGHIRPGETVLVVGASGGANTAYIQVAKLAGATVYVVGSSDEKLQKAQELGADYLINRNDEDWGKAIFQMTGKRGVDVVVDNVGAETWPTSLRALARGGRMLVVGGTSGYMAEVGVNFIFRRHLAVIGSTMAPRNDFRTVMSLIFARRLHAVIGVTMPMDDPAAAYERLRQGDFTGKLVLTP